MSNRGEPPYAIILKARTAYALIERELADADCLRTDLTALS